MDRRPEPKLSEVVPGMIRTALREPFHRRPHPLLPDELCEHGIELRLHCPHCREIQINESIKKVQAYIERWEKDHRQPMGADAG